MDFPCLLHFDCRTDFGTGQGVGFAWAVWAAPLNEGGWL